MPFTQLIVSTIGRAAARRLSGNPTVSIAGVTSRGVFLRVGEQGVVFLSLEAHHGPLTLNLHGDAIGLLALAAGEPAMLTDAGVVFPAHDLEVATGAALVWQAPPPPRASLLAGQVRANLRHTVEQLIAAQEDPSTSPGLLMDLRRLMAFAPAGDVAGGPFLPILKRLGRAVREAQPAAVAAALYDSLGRGPGLTPSGDDLALGFLLALARWGAVYGLQGQIETIRPQVLEAARRQTTTLAANLIECAADGQADERLIAALDGIVTGVLDAAGRAASLRSWGSSSGIDALAGMAAILLAAKDPER